MAQIGDGDLPVGDTRGQRPHFIVRPFEELLENSKLAQQFNVQGGWQGLQKLNAQYVPNADLILVGQKIATK